MAQLSVKQIVKRKTKHERRSTKTRHKGRNRSHESAYYAILIIVSCTEDYEHPYYDYAANPDSTEEGKPDEPIHPSDF